MDRLRSAQGMVQAFDFCNLTQLLWERACPANTGEAGAIHRAACFAGQARSHRDSAYLLMRVQVTAMVAKG